MANDAYLTLLSDNELALIGGGVQPDDLRTQLPEVIDRCEQLGIAYLMTGIGRAIRQEGKDWKTAVAELGEGCAKAAEAGLEVLYHNHAFEFESKVDGMYGLDFLLTTIPASDIDAELDVYWVQAGGEDPIAYIQKYADRLPLLHIKDMAPDSEKETCPFAEIGHGILDWDGIFAAAEAAEVTWYIVEQDRCVRPPMESARMSFEYLKSRGMT